jgi:hypothetical protein
LLVQQEHTRGANKKRLNSLEQKYPVSEKAKQTAITKLKNKSEPQGKLAKSQTIHTMGGEGELLQNNIYWQDQLCYTRATQLLHAEHAFMFTVCKECLI